jgi:hypothetical protein
MKKLLNSSVHEVTLLIDAYFSVGYIKSSRDAGLRGGHPFSVGIFSAPDVS